MTDPAPLGKPAAFMGSSDIIPTEPPPQSVEEVIHVGDVTVEAGLEIKARSQWSYARRRFIRHRLAMAGLLGLVIIFGAGVFANFIAPYSYSDIDLNNILHGPTTTAHHYFG